MIDILPLMIKTVIKSDLMYFKARYEVQAFRLYFAASSLPMFKFTAFIAVKLTKYKPSYLALVAASVPM